MILLAYAAIFIFTLLPAICTTIAAEAAAGELHSHVNESASIKPDIRASGNNQRAAVIHIGMSKAGSSYIKAYITVRRGTLRHAHYDFAATSASNGVMIGIDMIHKSSRNEKERYQMKPFGCYHVVKW